MKKLRITIGKKTYDVTVEVLDDGGAPSARPRPGVPTPAAASSPPPASAGAVPEAAPAAQGAVVAPMSGVIKDIQVKPGDDVAAGQVLAILEAMKMENQVTAPQSGSVQRVEVEAGQSVLEGQALVVIE